MIELHRVSVIGGNGVMPLTGSGIGPDTNPTGVIERFKEDSLSAADHHNAPIDRARTSTGSMLTP
jgi:hypothetical protein